jgi:hypothetical protein
MPGWNLPVPTASMLISGQESPVVEVPMRARRPGLAALEM